MEGIRKSVRSNDSRRKICWVLLKEFRLELITVAYAVVTS